MIRTIALIGPPEKISLAIAERLAKAGNHVLVTDQPAKHSALSIKTLRLFLRRNRMIAPQAVVEVIRSIREASWEADIILFATPYEAQGEVASKIKDVVTGKIIISMVNPLNKSHDGLLTPPTTSAAEELAELLPHSKVVKAFNTIFSLGIESLQFDRQAVDVFVAGDNDEAVSIVAQLVRDVGLIPLYAGQLSMSRTLESMMLLLAGVSSQNNYRRPIGWKVLHESVDQNENKQSSIK